MTSSIREERETINKLIQEAGLHCEQGRWEAALLLYQKGLQLRPHSMACRAGVMRASYVIKNTIKELDNTDTSSYKNTEENRPEQKDLNSVRLPNRKLQSQQNVVAEDKRSERSEFKELRRDMKFIQKTKEDSLFPENTGMYEMMENLYVLIKQRMVTNKQTPIILKRSDQVKRDPPDKETWNVCLELLESISDSTELLHATNNYLTALEKECMAEEEKKKIRGQLYYLILKAQVDLGDYKNAEKYKDLVMKVAEDTADEELCVRASYLEGRMLALSGNYSAAAITWKKLLKLTTNPDRLAHLLHEVGRCYFKIEWVELGRAYGVLSLKSAQQANNDVWVKNAALLIAQIEVTRGYIDDALENYAIAEAAARRLNDQRALISIICETSKLGKQPRRPKVDEKNVPIGSKPPQTSLPLATLRRPKIVSPNKLPL